VPLPDLAGGLTAADLDATADAVAAHQLPDGLILWFPGGHADPWNHVEAAMALTVAGRRAEAEAGYQWLVANQRPDGSWHQYYLADGVKDAKLDTNVIAYVAAGTWHHYLATGDAGFLETMWPVVERAVDFVLDLQAPGGEIVWARHADGTPWSFALLTGSSSVLHSLRCAIAIAEHLDHERPDWELSAGSLRHAIVHVPGAFAPKDRWAMDWYYPVLSGALTGAAARRRLAAGWDTFVLPDLGVRCVADRPWVTAAETCECAIAHEAAGEPELARALFAWAHHLRDDDGSYWTGAVFPEAVHFPGGEKTSYTAAAVILAADTLYGDNPTSGLFRDHTLPAGLDPDDVDDVDVEPTGP